MQNRQKCCNMPRIRFTSNYLPHIIIAPVVVTPNFGIVSKNGGGEAAHNSEHHPTSRFNSSNTKRSLGWRDGANEEVGSLASVWVGSTTNR